MTLRATTAAKIAQLLRCQSGNFAVLTAVMAVPLLLMTGVAIDYHTASTQRSQLQEAADAAVLYAASSGETDPAKLQAMAEKAFHGNIPSSLAGSARVDHFEVTPDHHVSITVSAKAFILLTRLIKPEGLDISVLSQALAGSDDKIEVALVLDNTYSMYGQKLTDLKSASNSLVKIFENVDKTKNKVKIAVVPFSRYVNVGTSYRGSAWLNVPDDYSTTQNVCTTSKPVISQSGCTTTTKTGYNDGVPYTYKSTSCTSVVYGEPVKTCADKTSTYKWSGCVGSRKSPFDVVDTTGDEKYTGLLNTSCGAALLPLSNNYTSIRAAITAMVANNETYIAPGILWGWNVLSSTQPFPEGLAYNTGVKKFIILMTDGTNTVSPSYPAHNGSSVSKSDGLMATVCANVKAKDITVYTVAVGIDAASSTATELAKCASAPDKAVLVQDSSKLTSTFEAIASQIVASRLTM